jgi:hypothetical protein
MHIFAFDSIKLRESIERALWRPSVDECGSVGRRRETGHNGVGAFI